MLIALVGTSQTVVPPILIVLVIDASKSALPVPRPTLVQLRELEEILLERNSGGTLAFAVIGNPKPEIRHFYRLDLAPVPVVKSDIVLTVKAKARNQAKLVIDKNERWSGEWKALYQQIVLKYKPNGPDISNVSEVFTKAALLLREPQYRNYLKILVFSSDLKNEPKRNNVVVPWKINLNEIPKLVIIGTGASDPNPFTNLSNYIVLADIGGLVPAVKNFLNN